MRNNLFKYKQYWIALAAWFILWPIAHAYLLIHFGTGIQAAWRDSLISNLLLAFFCFDITLIIRYQNSPKKGWYMPLLWTAGLAGLSIFIMNLIIDNFYSDQAGYVQFFQQTIPVRFVISFLIIGFFVMLDRLMFYISEQQEGNERKLNLEKLSKDAELAMLRQQLQPHFLFNTLNSISALVTTKPEEAKRMIQQLSDFLRSTVKKDDQKFVDLASELKQLQLYLDIEKVRFGHRLNTIIEHEPASLNLTLPPLLLQPLVENAIKFGLYDTLETVTIGISTKVENKHLLIAIENPFDSSTAKPQMGTGFGLSSVQRRLYLLFARNDLMQIQAKQNIFVVTVKIPQQA